MTYMTRNGVEQQRQRHDHDYKVNAPTLRPLYLTEETPMNWLSLIDDETHEPVMVNLDNVETMSAAYVSKPLSTIQPEPIVDLARVWIKFANGRAIRVQCTMQDIALYVPAQIIEAPTTYTPPPPLQDSGEIPF
jgi:hypothetical protein